MVQMVHQVQVQVQAQVLVLVLALAPSTSLRTDPLQHPIWRLTSPRTQR